MDFSGSRDNAVSPAPANDPDNRTPSRSSSRLFVPCADLLRRPSGTDWLLDRYLPRGSLATLFGEPGSFKTTVALDWALHIAAGRPWNGYAVRQGSVFYVAGEGHAGITNRMQAWKLHNREFADLPLFIAENAVSLDDLRAASDMAAEMEQWVAEVGDAPALIVIDTLARNMEGDENAQRDMNRFVRHVGTLQSRFGAAVLVLHHTGYGNKDRERGASALRAAVDASYLLERHKGAFAVTLTAKKMKDSSEPHPLRLELAQVNTGSVDSAGRMETALAVAAVTRSTGQPRRATGPTVQLTPNSTKVLKLVSDLTREIGQQLVEDRIPADVRVITVSALHERYREKYGDGVKPDTQRKQLERALDTLESSGHIVREGRYVWLVALASVA